MYDGDGSTAGFARGWLQWAWTAMEFDVVNEFRVEDSMYRRR